MGSPEVGETELVGIYFWSVDATSRLKRCDRLGVTAYSREDAFQDDCMSLRTREWFGIDG